MEQNAQTVPSPGLEATNRRRYTLTGDAVLKATADLPSEQRSALRWVDRYCREGDRDLTEIAHQLKKPDRTTYSRDSIYQALTGRREAGLARLCESITKFREYVERESGLSQTGFVETDLTKRVFRICDKAFIRHKVMFVWGESQVGKTTALEEYARLHNHGGTVYTRMPTGGSMVHFMEELCNVLGIGSQSKEKELRRRILNSFDRRMLLIVDECHQCFCSQYSTRPLLSLEFAREINDRRKCGLVLCGTNVFRDQLRKGGNGILRQLWLRRINALQLPDKPTQAQLDAFAARYGLEPAPDKDINVRSTDTGASLTDNPRALQSSVIKADGLGRWITLLQEAADMAKEKSRPVTWGHVLLSYAESQAMETLEVA